MGPAADLDLLRDSLIRALTWQEIQRIVVALKVLNRLGFSRQTPFPRLRTLYQQVAKPWMEWAFDNGNLDLGLELERLIYAHYIKAEETEIHARRTYEELLPSITRAAKTKTSGGAISPPREAGSRLPRVGYFLHHPSTLTHAETMLNVLASLHRAEKPPFDAIVYVGEGNDPAFDARIDALGVLVIRLDQCEGGQSPYSVLARFEILRQSLRQENVQVLVWMSALPWLAFVATMGLGVKLAWYSLKYHVLRLPGIDGYITNGDGGLREIRGHPWQTIRLSGRWFDPGATADARRERASLGPHRLTMGTLGREEKMAPGFVESVALLLRDHPDVLYIWSGLSQPPEVLRIFEKYGVGDRHRFLGWVNTPVVSQMIDIYLDSFPAPSGFTARESMAAGAASVFFRSPEADQTGPNGFIRRLLAGQGPEEDVSKARAIMQPGGESLFLLAETPAEYVSHARRLLEDDAFRARVGAANRTWITTFYEDDAGMLESHARAVLNI